jgi:hypothetical protein
MLVPVGRFDVEFDISHPHRICDFHLSVEEIRPLVLIVQTRIQHLDRATICSVELMGWKESVLPHIVQEFFHKFGLIKFGQSYVFLFGKKTSAAFSVFFFSPKGML